MHECSRVAALSSILASEPGARLLGCVDVVVYYHHGACRSGRLGNRRRPCQVLCRCRSSVWVASFFCRLRWLHVVIVVLWSCSVGFCFVTSGIFSLRPAVG